MGQAWPWGGLPARRKRHRTTTVFLCCGQEKAPRKGLEESGLVHEVVLALTRKEHVFPRVAACVATVEDDHFVVVHVGVHQVGAGDMAHVQRAAHALEYQDLADGIFLAHGVDAGSELVLEVGCGCDEVGEHGIAPVKVRRPGSLAGDRAGMR